MFTIVLCHINHLLLIIIIIVIRSSSDSSRSSSGISTSNSSIIILNILCIKRLSTLIHSVLFGYFLKNKRSVNMYLYSSFSHFFFALTTEPSQLIYKK